MIGQENVMSENKVIRGANAVNEMAILDREGLAGFHLVDFGPFRLVFEASDHVWEHMRLVLVPPRALLALQETGWIVVGHWFAFTYLKRRTDTPVGRG